MIRSSKYMIKRIIIGIGITLGVMFFKNYISFASVYNPSVYINGSSLNSGNFLTVGSPQQVDVYYDGYPEGLDDPNAFWLGSLVLCRDYALSGVSWYPAGSFSASSSLTINNTNLSCFYPNSNYTGGKITIITWKTRGGGSYNHVGFKIYSDGNSSLALVDLVISADKYALESDYLNISNYVEQKKIYQNTLNTYNAINNVNSSISIMSTALQNSINNSQNQTNSWLEKVESAQKAMKDAMESDNIDNDFSNSKIGEIAGKQYGNASISDIVLLPVKLLQVGVTGLGSNSCSDITLGNLYGTDLTLPCISSSSMNIWLGSALYTIIDILLSFGIILGIRKLVLKIYNTIIFLKEGGGTID